MELIALGINHQTAPVTLREQVAFAETDIPAVLAGLKRLPAVREVALLSTCNRTELYALCTDAGETLVQWLGSHPEGRQSLHAYIYLHRGQEAARHLFRVASGLDSLVLGEPQILGQVKHAWALARAEGALGSQLDRLFQHAFVTAKRARSQTRIGANPVSVASMAVRLTEESFARPADSAVLLIGAGETIELTARHLTQARVKRLMVANRTWAHAQELAVRYDAVALPLEELDRHLFMADIVVSATASREPIVHAGHVRSALTLRRQRPMLLMDLAVPRDIDPAIGELDDAYLYTVDDLERLVEDSRRSRREAAADAETIIDLQLAQYRNALAAGRHIAPLKRLREHGERTRDALVDKARQQLHNGRAPDVVLDWLAHTLTNALLHPPTVALRDAALNGDLELARALERLLPQPAPTEPGAFTAAPTCPDTPTPALPNSTTKRP